MAHMGWGIVAILDGTRWSYKQKLDALRRALGGLDSLMVAYSGGTDSAYLAYEAHEMMGERMLAVIADSPSLPRGELAAALDFADEHGIPLTHSADARAGRPGVRAQRQRALLPLQGRAVHPDGGGAGEVGFAQIAYGRNLDDDGDLRPGQRAAAMHRALAPLAEAGLGKLEIRRLAREAGLTVADKPASACLSSRIEYGRTGDGGEPEPGGARRGGDARARASCTCGCATTASWRGWRLRARTCRGR